jgi:hypothetical protein
MRIILKLIKRLKTLNFLGVDNAYLETYIPIPEAPSGYGNNGGGFILWKSIKFTMNLV